MGCAVPSALSEIRELNSICQSRSRELFRSIGSRPLAARENCHLGASIASFAAILRVSGPIHYPNTLSGAAADPAAPGSSNSRHKMMASSFAGQAVVSRPAVARQQRSTVTQIVAKQSRIGKLPIPVPDKVQVTLDGNVVKVKVRQAPVNTAIRFRCG
jgi:hypothetical protein